MAESDEGHWRDRPVLAAAVRLLATVFPLASGIALGLLVAVALPAPTTTYAFLGWWALVLLTSVLGLKLADRLARRLLPLAVLLELSLLFPEHAPSRFKTALTSGSTKHLHEHLAAAHKAGVGGDPSQAAEAILALVGALGSHHRPSRKHSERVRAYTDLLAEELDLPARDRHRLRWASLLHDVGKVHVPLDILDGSGALSTDAWEVIQRHPMEGGKLIAPLWDWLGPWAPTVEQHHERFDGAGYPLGLKGDDICLGARIVAVADSFEAMTARRTYQEPMSVEDARTRLAHLAGSQLDPTAVRAFLAISVKRLRWAYGPMAWLVEAPVLFSLSKLAPLAGTGLRAGTAALGFATIAATTGTLPPAEVLGTSFSREPAQTPTGTQGDPAGGTATTPPPSPAATAGGTPGPGAVTTTTGGTGGSTTTVLPPVTVPPTPTLPPVVVTIPTLPPLTVPPTPTPTPTTTLPALPATLPSLPPASFP